MPVKKFSEMNSPESDNSIPRPALPADLHDSIGPFLQKLVDETDPLARREADPVGMVWRYDAPADREVAGLVASTLAYGRVGVLREAIAEVFDVLGPSPADFLMQARAAVLSEGLADFVYRMTRGPDLVDLLVAIGRTLRQHGSLEGLYASTDGGHLARASAFVRALRAERVRDELTRGFRYLLPDPADGSTTKRLHMYFRWMVRGPDEVDFGIWSAAEPARLVIPLDTHTSRICRYLGLTTRKSTDLKTAIEVTNALREVDPDDPLRFDFSLAHLGISGRCIHRRSPEHCPGCPIEAVCRL